MHNVYSSETNNTDNLVIMGQMPVVTESIKLCAGTWERGQVIGIDSESGIGTIVDMEQSNGRQTPYAIMAETVFSAAEFYGAVFLTGEFNADALIVGSGTIDDYKQEMRRIGLIVRDVQKRGN